MYKCEVKVDGIVDERNYKNRTFKSEKEIIDTLVSKFDTEQMNVAISFDHTKKIGYIDIIDDNFDTIRTIQYVYSGVIK